MSGYRCQIHALAVSAAMLLVAGEASAQYCDPRFDPSCRAYPPQGYPPQISPQPFWRNAPVQRQEMPQPGPTPRYEPARPTPLTRPVDPALGAQYAALYAAVGGEPHPVPGVRLSDIDSEYLRKSVSFPTNEPAGTIVIDAQNRFLYFVQGGGRAIRYGVGVGRQGFGWSGTATIHDKQEWPDWYPPKEMIARQPDLRRQLTDLQSGIGMPGGPRNPLGARAMYLWQGNKDTLYRIHGTFEPWTIGKNVSSGCIRMINQDVIDLYQRTAAGAKVVVLASRS
jgi:lipoprotein-anchoring transpeptidase ErfK/SrfK